MPSPAEQMFWAEINDPQSTRRSLQICYAFMLATHIHDSQELWIAVNRSVVHRFKLKTVAELKRFQEQSLCRHRAAAAQVCPTFPPPEEQPSAESAAVHVA